MFFNLVKHNDIHIKRCKSIYLHVSLYSFCLKEPLSQIALLVGIISIFAKWHKKFKHIRNFWVFGRNSTYCNFSFTRGCRSVKKAKCVLLWKTKSLREVAFHFSKCLPFIFPFFFPMIPTYIMETNGEKITYVLC